jgi:hypothetical protein
MHSLRQRLSLLGFAAFVSAAILLALVAGIVTSGGDVRMATGFGRQGRFGAVGIAEDGVCISLRRTNALWRARVGARVGAPPVRWGYVNRVADSPLTVMCIKPQGKEWWIAPGVWLGAGRDTYVDYLDLILPHWLLMPACGVLPALWYRRRGRQSVAGFEVVATRREDAQQRTPAPLGEEPGFSGGLERGGR